MIVEKGADDDFRADSGAVAHRDRDDGAVVDYFRRACSSEVILASPLRLPCDSVPHADERVPVAERARTDTDKSALIRGGDYGSVVDD